MNKKTQLEKRGNQGVEEIFEQSDHTSRFPPERKPWSEMAKVSVVYSHTKKTQSEEQQRKAGEEAIEMTKEQDITFFTDGLAACGNCFGGAGVVIVNDSNEAQEFAYPAGRWTSSYQTELTATHEALKLATNQSTRKERKNYHGLKILNPETGEPRGQ